MKRKQRATQKSHPIKNGLALELERKRRQRMREGLKESEVREAQEKAGQSNLFATKEEDY